MPATTWSSVAPRFFWHCTKMVVQRHLTRRPVSLSVPISSFRLLLSRVPRIPSRYPPRHLSHLPAVLSKWSPSQCGHLYFTYLRSLTPNPLQVCPHPCSPFQSQIDWGFGGGTFGLPFIGENSKALPPVVGESPLFVSFSSSAGYTGYCAKVSLCCFDSA